MSDEQEPHATRRPGEHPDPAETGRSPFAGEPGPVERPRSGDSPGAGIDRTAQMPAVPGDDGTRTAAGPGDDGTRILPPVADATVVTPQTGRMDATSIMPPVDLPDAGRAEAAARAAAGRTGSEDDVWTARAQVRAPRPGQGGDYTPTDWVPTPAEPRRAWWLPIVIGTAVLLLLGALGTGIWLITQGSDDETPATPAPVPTAPATDATTDAEPEPTTTRPTTEPSPTPTTDEPTTEEPAEVEVPTLVGLSSQDARAALDGAGLAYRLSFRRSETVPAGTVIDSDPAQGRRVPADTEVTLVIASAATPSPSGTSEAPADEEPPDED